MVAADGLEELGHEWEASGLRWAVRTEHCRIYYVHETKTWNAVALTAHGTLTSYWWKEQIFSTPYSSSVYFAWQWLIGRQWQEVLA